MSRYQQSNLIPGENASLFLCWPDWKRQGGRQVIALGGGTGYLLAEGGSVEAKLGMCLEILDVRELPPQPRSAPYLLGTRQTSTQEGDFN